MGCVRLTPVFACLVASLFLVGFFPVVLADLPDPPAPGTTSGPLAGVSGAYTGGVLIVPKPQAPIDKAVDKPMGTITCEAISILYNFGKVKSEMGVSVHGPISDAQTQGIVDAINAVRPPKTVDLGSYVMEGSPTEIRSWTWKSTTYTHTHYEIWVVRQASPAVNELVGYINVEIPKMANVEMTSSPCPVPATPGSSVNPVPGPNLIDSFFDVYFPLPDDGWPPLIGYGPVKVLDGAGQTAAAGAIRPGETVVFRLPPGTYTAVVDIEIVGLHLSSVSNTVTSPPDATAVLLSVNLILIEEIVYIIIVIAIAAVALLIYGLARWYRGSSNDRWFKSHVVASRKYFEGSSLPNGISKPGLEVHMLIPHRNPSFNDPGKALKIAEAIMNEFDGNGRSHIGDVMGEMKVGLVKTYEAGPFDGSTDALLWQLDGKVIPRGYRLGWEPDGSQKVNSSGPRLVSVTENAPGNFPASLVGSIRSTETNFVNDIDSDTPVWWQLKQVLNTMNLAKPGHGKIKRSLSGGYHVETGLETTEDLRRTLEDDRGRVYFSELLREGVGAAGCITFKWKAVAKRQVSRRGGRGWSRWHFVKPMGWEEEVTLQDVLSKPWVSMPQPTRRRQYDEWARGREN